jgi:hypothetical protein
MEGTLSVDEPAPATTFEAAVAEHYPGLVRRLTVVVGGDVETGQGAGSVDETGPGIADRRLGRH